MQLIDKSKPTSDYANVILYCLPFKAYLDTLAIAVEEQYVIQAITTKIRDSGYVM